MRSSSSRLSLDSMSFLFMIRSIALSSAEPIPSLITSNPELKSFADAISWINQSVYVMV